MSKTKNIPTFSIIKEEDYRKEIDRLLERNCDLDKALQLNLQTIQNITRSLNEQIIIADNFRREVIKNQQLFDVQSFMQDRITQLEYKNETLTNDLHNTIKNKSSTTINNKKKKFKLWFGRMG